jgi:transglutaminase-like putative cysteine protease
LENDVDAMTNEMAQAEDLEAFLQPGVYVNSDHPDIVAFAKNVTKNATSPSEMAVALYYAVRDEIRYDPYVEIANTELYYANQCLASKRGFCISKAVLLAACARAVGIASRVAFADVKNHLCTPRLREIMQTDLFTHHGFTELYLNGRWVKVTPTFNIELCERFGVVALDFDGENDALLHPFDSDGRRHMEYVRSRGAYADVPVETLRRAMLDTYGEDVCNRLTGAGDFAAEAAVSGTI